jgi:oligopeptide transport system ATP-binding protein
MSGNRPMLRVEAVAKRYRLGRQVVRAVDRVTLEVMRGETLGLVGESGCGKSTLARLMCCLEAPTEGRVLLEGLDLTALRPREMRPLRQRLQMVFQDPFASLNPHQTVARIVGLPLRIRGGLTKTALRARVADLLRTVGLSAAQAHRFPHQLSGGQRQRVGIARALACDPQVIVADEPLASLDVSVQAQILQVLQELRGRLGMTAVFISHDVSVVSHISQRIAVMYLGRVVEVGPARAVIEEPRHPYTRALLAAVPRLGRGRPHPTSLLQGDPPSQLHVSRGCRYRTRCSLEQTDQCHQTEPKLEDLDDGHSVACHLATRDIR